MSNNDLQRKVKHLEQENDYLKQIISLMPGNVYWKNKKGCYLGCNKNAADLVGLKTQEDIVGKTLYDLVPHSMAQSVDKTDKRIMRKKKEERVEELGFDVSRNPATYLSVKTPLYNKKQKVTGLLCVSVDITVSKLAEKALREAKEKAEEMNRMKSEFIHNMEHDIRTPFSGIYSMSSILAKQEMDLEKKEALQLISQSSKELLEYANHILAFAQIEEAFHQSVLKHFSIRKLVQSVITMEKPPAKIKALELIATISDNVPDTVCGDPARLKGILINLISNAIKFTKKGRVTVNVTVTEKNKKTLLLSFEIKDTGIGIPKEKQHSIYDKFFRLNSSHKDPLEGFGLGLQVVKKFITELGGALHLESTLGKGSVFTVKLPFKVQHSVQKNVRK